MIRFIRLPFCVYFGIACLFSIEVFGQTAVSRLTVEPVLLEQKLRDIGDKYNKYFTIETGLEMGDYEKSIEGKKVSPDMSKKGLRKDLELLCKAIPNLTFVYDSSNSKIIHIIDTRLPMQKNYAMEKPLANFAFDGNIFNFVKAIGKKGVNISAKGGMSSSEALVVDFATEVSVKVKNIDVRSILSKAVRIETRSRILWVARTNIAKNQTTYIRYFR